MTPRPNLIASHRIYIIAATSSRSNYPATEILKYCLAGMKYCGLIQEGMFCDLPGENRMSGMGERLSDVVLLDIQRGGTDTGGDAD